MNLEGEISPRHSHESTLDKQEHFLYHTQVEELLFAATYALRDIFFVVWVLAGSALDPPKDYLRAITKILRNLPDLASTSIWFVSHVGLETKAFLDSGWAGFKESYHRTTDMTVTFIDASILQKSGQKLIVWMSSTEARYKALSSTAKEVLWVRRLCSEVYAKSQFAHIAIVSLILFYNGKTELLHDNNDTTQEQNTKMSSIIIFSLNIEGIIAIISVMHVTSDEQAADMLTKALSCAKLKSWDLMFMEKVNVGQNCKKMSFTYFLLSMKVLHVLVIIMIELGFKFFSLQRHWYY